MSDYVYVFSNMQDLNILLKRPLGYLKCADYQPFDDSNKTVSHISETPYSS